MQGKKPTMASVMTPFPHTIEAARSLDDAKLMMSGGGFRHLPVTRAGALFGLITDRDLKLAMSVTKGDFDVGGVCVGDVCLDEIYVVDVNTHLEDVVSHMAQSRIGSALVTRADKLVGIFTTTDVCKHFAEFLKRQFPDA